MREIKAKGERQKMAEPKTARKRFSDLSDEEKGLEVMAWEKYKKDRAHKARVISRAEYRATKELKSLHRAEWFLLRHTYISQLRRERPEEEPTVDIHPKV